MRFLVALAVLTLGYIMLKSLKPLDVGALAVGGRVEVPYSWDINGPRVVLASVTPPEPKWLRVASFSIYVGNAWLKGNEDLSGRPGGAEYKVGVTPYAIMLYPALPVPQPAPGYAPQGRGLLKVQDEFRSNSFVTTVRVKYGPPFPYGDYPELNYRVSAVLGEAKHWSTPRVQKLAKELLEKFRNRTLKDLLGYLTSWLRRNYDYATRYSGTPAKDAADWFLFVSRTGMCAHFATAAAVLLNDMGIRARVVYGFAISYVNNGLRVFTTPTHLWVEVWTPGGWVPWDPSPPLTSAGTSVATLRRPALQAPRGPEGMTEGMKMNRSSENTSSTSHFAGVPLEFIVVVPIAMLASVYVASLREWFVAWPLAFRGCVERLYGVKGLTLKEVAKITGIEDLERVQKEYLLRGKWPRRGILKAVYWCIAWWARRIRYKRR